MKQGKRVTRCTLSTLGFPGGEGTETGVSGLVLYVREASLNNVVSGSLTRSRVKAGSMTETAVEVEAHC